MFFFLPVCSFFLPVWFFSCKCVFFLVFSSASARRAKRYAAAARMCVSLSSVQLCRLRHCRNHQSKFSPKNPENHLNQLNITNKNAIIVFLPFFCPKNRQNHPRRPCDPPHNHRPNKKN